MSSNLVVRQVRAFETETVEIRWELKDGTFYYQRFTVPPKATRDERNKNGVYNEDSQGV